MGEDAIVNLIGFAVVLLVILGTINHYFRNSLLPPEAWILLLGIGYAIVRRTKFPWMPSIHLNPHILFFVILPLLIFASGHLLKPKHIRSQLFPISFFAFIGVFSSLIFIGWPIAYLMGIPVQHGLFFAAAVSATDPGAVAAVLKRFKLPEALRSIGEGESLFNDGLAVVLFAACAKIVLDHESVDVTFVGLSFVWAILGALFIGYLYGWGIGKVLERWQEYRVSTELTFSLILALSAFLIGEELLHVSGVMTVLAAGMSFSKVRAHVQFSPQTLDRCDLFDPFWSYMSLLLNGLLFFVLGFETGNHEFPLTWLLLEVVVVLVLARAILIYGGSVVLRIFRFPLPLMWQNVLMLSGLRGPIAIALVLMMPEDYEYRITFLCLAFMMNLVPLLIQPALLQQYLRLGFGKEG